MDGKRGIGNWRGWRKMVWLVIATVCFIAGIVVFFPNSLVNQQLAASLTNYLVTKLGPEAICGSVDLGWRHLSLQDVTLPLDDHGSVLTIERIEASVDPLVALSQPSEYTRIIRSINIVHPELTYYVLPGKKVDADTTKKPVVPDAVFEAVSRMDSLRTITLERGGVTILGKDTAFVRLDDLRGVFVNSVDGLDVRMNARGDLPVGFELQIDGLISASTKTVELQAIADFAQCCVTIDSSLPATVSLESGTATLSLTQSGENSRIVGGAKLSGASLQVASHIVRIPDAEIEFRDNVLSLDSADVLSPGLNAVLWGSLNLADSMRLGGALDARLDLSEGARALTIADSGITGAAQISASIAGTIAKPQIEAILLTEKADIFGQAVERVSVDVGVSQGTVTLRNAVVHNEYADASLQGEVKLKTPRNVSLLGSIYPKSIPDFLGQKFGAHEIAFAVEGEPESPSLSWVARDSVGELLGNGSAEVASKNWTLSFAKPNGQTGLVSVSEADGQWHVSAANAHIVVPVVYPTTARALNSVTNLEIEFQGDDSAGTGRVSIRGDSDDKSVLTQVLRELQFDGSYTKDSDNAYNLNGRWVGLSGEGEEFFGQGNVTIHDDVLTIENLYFDEAGSVEGSVRLDKPLVDLKISIEQLPLSKTPFVASAASKWKLGGQVSGEMIVTGPKDSLKWNVDLSLVDGVAQGVPGYWGLLAANGVGEEVNAISSSFGRGVRSIFEFNGALNLSENTIDVKVNFPASECADFIQALSGRSGILSGDLDGEILVFGKLNAPDVVASIRVSRGELLGELTVDRFALDAALATERDGRRLLTIPQLSFYKEGKYNFYGELSAEPRTGGEFRGYLEGNGDFLDLLQQVDADFTSIGSQSSLRAEVGGTWEKPQFEGTELTIRDGKFTYPPATPGVLVMNTILRLNSEGVLDTGRIQVNAGTEYLRVDFVDSSDHRADMLTPLVIPGIGIQLGVIVLSTSEDGLPVRLPGFMKPEWLGKLTTGAGDYNAITISAFDSTRLRIGGQALIRDARFTFPFFSYGGGRIRPVTRWLVDRLYESWWNLEISMGNGSHYDVEITGFKDSDLFEKMGDNFLVGTVAEYLDHISVDAIVSPTDKPLLMEGALVDSTMRLSGKLGATSGKADYLDQTFWIEKLQAEFDETDILPIISGRSATYGIDSVGRTVPVYLTIYEIDEETDTRVPYGRFEDVTYVLEADGYPDQEQVLALLGYDLTNMSQGKAEQLLTRTALTAAKRVWLDPISRKLERATFFDEISLAPGGGASASIFRQQREAVLRDTLESNTAVKFLTGSNVTVGKYFGKDIFLTYTGELAEAAGEVEGGRLGLIHYWNLQYRVAPVSPDFVLDFAIEYDEASRRRDQSVALKYSFVLEP